MGAFYVPFTFITTCYVVIFVKLRGKMKKRREKVEEQQQNIEMKRRNLCGKRFSRVNDAGVVVVLLLWYTKCCALGKISKYIKILV